MKFSRLVTYFERVEATTLRNQKTEILAELLKEADPDEVAKLVYLSLGGLRPKFDRLEFNMAEKLILRAIGASEKQYQEIGDIGELAKKLIPTSPGDQSVQEVYEELETIASDSGSGSQDRKVARLSKLLAQVGTVGAKYLARMVAGKLRLGFSDKTVIDALSYFESGTKSESAILDSAYQRRPDVGYLAEKVKEMGTKKAVESIDLAIGTPIMPALAQRLKTASEMIEKMGKVIAEAKYDGTRVQIHFSKNINSNLQFTIYNKELNSNSQTGLFGEESKPKFWVRTFTRNLDESSEMFPELAEILPQIDAKEVILDSEAVGYDTKTDKLLPFQMTITRKRKHGIGEASSAVPLKFFVFDIMYLDGKSLIDLPLSERKKILAGVIRGSGPLVVDEYIETESPDELRAFHARQLAEGLEGALVKQIEGKYMPGRVGYNWVKFKESEDSRAKLADTLDVIIMGYYSGRGKRSTFGLGAFLVGIKSGEEIVTIAKVGTGISDEQFGELYKKLRKLEIKSPRSEYKVPKILIPDVWVEPEIVVEVAADEITKSPTHTAGYALRFPRLVKFRDDKSVGEITTLEEVVHLA